MSYRGDIRGAPSRIACWGLLNVFVLLESTPEIVYRGLRSYMIDGGYGGGIGKSGFMYVAYPSTPEVIRCIFICELPSDLDGSIGKISSH